MNVARAMREARLRAGLSQSALAERVGTSQATLSAYENGRKRPSVETLARLLAATGARLTVETGAQPLLRPSRSQHAKVSRELPEVLGLAEALPARHETRLRYPSLASPSPSR